MTLIHAGFKGPACGTTPRPNPTGTVLAMHSISRNADEDPTPLHARGARGTHFLQSCVCTRPVLVEVTNVTPEDGLWQNLGIRGRLILHPGLKSSHKPGSQPLNVRCGNARIHYVSADSKGNGRIIFDIQ